MPKDNALRSSGVLIMRYLTKFKRSVMLSSINIRVRELGYFLIRIFYLALLIGYRSLNGPVVDVSQVAN